METKVEARLGMIEAALEELHEAAEEGTLTPAVIEGSVYDQLGEISNTRIGTSESDHDKVDLRLIAMEIFAMIGTDTRGLLRVIWRDPDASLQQKLRAFSIWFRVWFRGWFHR